MMEKLNTAASLLRGIAKLQRTDDAVADAIGMAEAVERAIAALTPRVLTLAEIAAQARPVWIEMEGDEDGEWAMYAYEHAPHLMFATFGGGMTAPVALSAEAYGQTWRAWTDRPSYDTLIAAEWATAPTGATDEMDD